MVLSKKKLRSQTKPAVNADEDEEVVQKAQPDLKITDE